jgi:hypothetical protein
MVERKDSPLQDLSTKETNFLLKMLGFSSSEDDIVLTFTALPIQVKWPSVASKIRTVSQIENNGDVVPERMSDFINFLKNTPPFENVTLEELAIILEKQEDVVDKKKNFRKICEKHLITLIEFPPNPSHKSEPKNDEEIITKEIIDPSDNSLSINPNLSADILQIPDSNDLSKKEDSKKKIKSKRNLRLPEMVETKVIAPLKTTNSKEERIRKIALYFFETQGGDFKYKTIQDIACEVFKEDLSKLDGDPEELLKECIYKISMDRESISQQLEKIFSLPSLWAVDLNDDFMRGFYRALMDSDIYGYLDADTLKKIMMRQISYQEICAIQNIANGNTVSDFKL